MSTKAVTDFFAKATEDDAIVVKIQDGTLDEKIAAAVSVGAEHGFSFTAAECQEVLEVTQRSAEGALSEAQLEGVAGGGAKLLLGQTWAWVTETFGIGGTKPDGTESNAGTCGVRA